MTLEAYLTQRGWEGASLEQCPACQGRAGCRLARHGTYERKHPKLCPVPRWYCATAGQTFSLLPDFLASRVSGTLSEIEEVAVAIEQGDSQSQAVDRLRPADEPGAVTLPSALRWLRRRQRWVLATLVIAVTLMPELSGCPPRITDVRTRLGTEQALRNLRERNEPVLHSWPAPVGFGPLPKGRAGRTKRFQQRMGRDPPGANE